MPYNIGIRGGDGGSEMLEYLQTYYIVREFGPGYVVTNVFFAVAVVLLLSDVRWDMRGVLRAARDAFACWLGGVAFCSAANLLFGRSGLNDRAMMALTLLVYALARSKYRPATRALRAVVFYSCMMQILTVSEPLGEAVKNYINESYTWAEHLTSLVVVLMSLAVLLFMRRFSTEKISFLPTFPAVLVTGIAAVGVLLQMGSEAIGVPKSYAVLVAGCFWLLELVGYYMFYVVSMEYDKNLELLSIQHKEALDEELLAVSRDNFEEMHKIRHEIKNHLAYIKALAEHGEYEKLREYLVTVSGETEALFRFVECGNDVVNAVMNHAIKQAETRGVTVETQIVVPKVLPYRETELCSLLSNLMDNAVEGAAASGAEHPAVTVSIRPQQDYLFLRVTNPVDGSISDSRRLSLQTTKEDRRLHGYGTKIIRAVAERYQGSVKFDVRDGRFVADVMLYLEEEANDGETLSGHL